MEDRRRRELDERADLAHGAMVSSWLDGDFESARAACRLLAHYFGEMAGERIASDNVIAFPGKGLGAAANEVGSTAAPFASGLECRT